MNKMKALIFAFLLSCLKNTWVTADGGFLSSKDVEQIEKTTEWENFIQEYNRQRDAVPTKAYGNQDFKCPPLDVDPPKDIHTLSPKYISVVAALGDSLTAANGADAKTLPGVARQFRGVSFSIGGDGTLEKTLTLPNVIKKYNPDVFGASKGSTTTVKDEKSSQLNVGVPGSKAKDLPGQANMLIQRLGKYSKYNDNWKVVTIFIGANDVCACSNPKDPDATVKGWADDITRSLDILASGLAKTFVNLVNVIMVGELRAYEYYTTCSLTHRSYCPCVMQSNKQHNDTDKLTRKYQAALLDIPQRYSNRSDFTVVLQPYSENVIIPFTHASGSKPKPDLSFLAPDCFHFSQRGHAAAAAGLWNNMFQPADKKQKFIDPTSVELICPQEDCPYLRTSVNSISCYKKR